MNQPYQQPPQQWGAPQQPQPQQPVGFYTPPQQPASAPGMFQPPTQIAAAAGQNLFNTMLQQPIRNRANRAKPADGSYVIRMTPGCKLDFSQKDGRPFLLLEYQVVEGSVPAMQGQVFSTVQFWTNRPQIEDLADLAKHVFGQNLPAVAQQVNGNPQAMAQAICQTVSTGLYAGVKVQRSPKSVQQNGYENAFANHNWIMFSQAPVTLAQLGPMAGPPAAPTYAPQPQQAWPAPAAPVAPQQAWTAPAPAAPAPQQHWNPAVAQPLPQAPALPQAQPAPAFYVPGAQPPR